MTDVPRTAAAYLRTSTDHAQSPADSRRTQLATAERLLAPAERRIVEVFHDVAVSRSIPWSRRPEASRLLAALPNMNRGWDTLVIAEPQRAFSGAQFQQIAPQLAHWGVELWVPEVGGRVDPDSEAHELLMSMFGGLSKAERRRIQVRTRNAVLAHGAEGRWLGGRVNFGYRIVSTGLPHPNPSKASAGVELRTLEPDPEAAPIVARIFEMAAEGVGYRSIADRLEREGVPSPGEAGPKRHARSAGVWGGSAVRAILTNPRYLGHNVVGRQRRHDELIDPTDPGLGTASRQRWQTEDTWVWSTDEAWPALVTRDLWDKVNSRITNNRDPRARRPRSEPGKYVLSGLIRCGACDCAMHGATFKQHAYYRCGKQRADYAPSAVTKHPRTSVREDRILEPLDEWIAGLFAPENIDATAARIVAADAGDAEPPPSVRRAHAAVSKLEVELDRVVAAIRQGMDPELAVGATRDIQQKLAAARQEVAAWESGGHQIARLTESDIATALERAGDLAGLLDHASRADRADLYRALGVTVEHFATGEGESVRVGLDQISGGGRI